MNKALLVILGVPLALAGGWALLSQVEIKNASAVPFAADVHHQNRLIGEWLVQRSFPLPKCGDREAAAGGLEAYKVAPITGSVGEMYTWTDAKGEAHFSDDLAEVPEAQRNQAKVESLPALEVYRGEYSRVRVSLANVKPLTPRRAGGGTGGRVTAIVYSAQWCGACKTTKAFLAKQGVVVEERDIDQDPRALAELVALAGKQASIPVTIIGKKVVGGFDEPALTAAVEAAR